MTGTEQRRTRAQENSRRVPLSVVGKVCRSLKKSYGTPRLGNPRSALDDLVYIILSNKTAPQIARQVFKDLKTRFPVWDAALRAGARRLGPIMRPAGLSGVKSAQIAAALKGIKADFGRCTLEGLRAWYRARVEAYLTSLPGVSLKVAKCVMMYTLGFQVLPVDAHVHRIARRLGWTARKRADQCHEELESLVQPKYRYSFHVDCIMHGRTICRPSRPDCDRCPIGRYCKYPGVTQ